MKTRLFPFALLLITMVGGMAQTSVPVHVAVAPSAAPLLAPRTAPELEQLLAPIALYPDALIALILPAATVPTDVVLAARHIRESGADRSQIEHRAWDESVKSLTHYPEVLQWMDVNLDWTRQVGEAFAQQPAEVMQAMQRLRAKARAAGTLVDTPQQQIISEPQVIRIVPAQPDVIYVPHYQPEVVFIDRPIYYSQPVVSFGIGVPVGSWLASDCDWRRNSIWVGNRHRRWTGHDWHRPVVAISPVHTGNPDVRQWCPPPHVHRARAFAGTPGYRPQIVRPSPFGAPHARPHSSYAPHPDGGDLRRGAAGDSNVAGLPPPHTLGTDMHPDFVGPRAPTGAVVPPVGWSAPAPGTAAPTLPPQVKRPGGEGRQNRDANARGLYRPSAPQTGTPVLPMATPLSAPGTHPVAPPTEARIYPRSGPRSSAQLPSLPMATPPSTPGNPVAAPSEARTYPRSGHRSSAHVPSGPMATPQAAPSNPIAPPSEPRNFARSNQRVPTAMPSLPMASPARSAPVGPTVEAAPAAQPARPVVDGGNGRGGRHNSNDPER